MSEDGVQGVAQQRLDNLREEVRLLAAPATDQARWLGSRSVKLGEDELLLQFLDAWPSWRQVLSPVMTAQAEVALDQFQRFIEACDVEALDDLHESLAQPGWDETRRRAATVLDVLLNA